MKIVQTTCMQVIYKYKFENMQLMEMLPTSFLLLDCICRSDVVLSGTRQL